MGRQMLCHAFIGGKAGVTHRAHPFFMGGKGEETAGNLVISVQSAFFHQIKQFREESGGFGVDGTDGDHHLCIRIIFVQFFHQFQEAVGELALQREDPTMVIKTRFFPGAQELLQPGDVLVALGGVCYSVGAVFYAIKKPTISAEWTFHEIFHILILAGSLFHYLAVYFYVL